MLKRLLDTGTAGQQNQQKNKALKKAAKATCNERPRNVLRYTPSLTKCTLKFLLAAPGRIVDLIRNVCLGSLGREVDHVRHATLSRFGIWAIKLTSKEMPRFQKLIQRSNLFEFII